MMIADDSYSGSIVSILNISCDVSRYDIHDNCLSGKYRGTIVTIEIYPDTYHDAVSLAVSSRFSCVLCFSGCTRASCMLFGHSKPRVYRDVSSQGSLSKVSNIETSQLEGIPCHEWYSVLLRSAQLSLLVSTRLGTWLFPWFPTRLETWNSHVVNLDLPRSMKVNEFADLTTSEFVSEYI